MTNLPQALPVPIARSRVRKSQAASRAKNVKTLRAVGVNVLALLVAFVTLFPILWMISTAFKPQTEIASLTPHLAPLHPTWTNFHAAMSGAGTGYSFWSFAKASLFVTVGSVVFSAVLSLLAAVAVARFRFRFRTSFLVMLLVVQMLPQQALVIALFVDFRNLNLLDSLSALLVLYTAFALPISVWMLRNFVATVPKDLEEAAAIDGATPWRVFWRILFPLVAPGLVATSVFSFIFAWNEFTFALTFLGVDYARYTLPLYVPFFFGRGFVNWGAIMATSVLYTIPPVVFFMIVQRRMASGLTAGAVKG
ncbi:MAG TPA: carbohydrate ABC transporter permease [Streptosporangiaceae bacterium]|nr:carbohydrate ABC transporter permease [Streptosporangiaceae bacterium]